MSEFRYRGVLQRGPRVPARGITDGCGHISRHKLRDSNTLQLDRSRCVLEKYGVFVKSKGDHAFQPHTMAMLLTRRILQRILHGHPRERFNRNRWFRHSHELRRGHEDLHPDHLAPGIKYRSKDAAQDYARIKEPACVAKIGNVRAKMIARADKFQSGMPRLGAGSAHHPFHFHPLAIRRGREQFLWRCPSGLRHAPPADRGQMAVGNDGGKITGSGQAFHIRQITLPDVLQRRPVHADVDSPGAVLYKQRICGCIIVGHGRAQPDRKFSGGQLRRKRTDFADRLQGRHRRIPRVIGRSPDFGVNQHRARAVGARVTRNFQIASRHGWDVRG